MHCTQGAELYEQCRVLVIFPTFFRNIRSGKLGPNRRIAIQVICVPNSSWGTWYPVMCTPNSSWDTNYRGTRTTSLFNLYLGSDLHEVLVFDVLFGSGVHEVHV